MIKSNTKIIIRNLPKSITKDVLLSEISNPSQFNYFRFCQSNKSRPTNRAYVNFNNVDDMYELKDRLENRVFVDEDGNESVCVVEFAVNQRVPARSKHDSKQNTLASDPEFLRFVEECREPARRANIGSAEANLEEIKAREATVAMNAGGAGSGGPGTVAGARTPLLEYLASVPRKERGKRDGGGGEYRRKGFAEAAGAGGAAGPGKASKKHSGADVHSIGGDNGASFSNNGENKPIKSSEMIHSAKKNLIKDSTNEAPGKAESSKGKSIEGKSEFKKNKISSQRSDIKSYAAAYEEYEYESREKRGFENKNYRPARSGNYEGDDIGSYYYSSRSSDGYYRNYNYGGYSDYHSSYSRAPQPVKNKRGGSRRPPAYSATRKD